MFTSLYSKSLKIDSTKIEDKIDTTFIIQDLKKAQNLKISIIDHFYDKEIWYIEYQVRVIDIKKQDTIQTFKNQLTSSYEESDWLQFEDVNFDGIEDIVMLSNIAANGINRDYEYWIYYPEQKIYIYDKKLTDLLGCNPIIDNYRKEFRTGGVTGCLGGCYHFETYKFIKGKLTLIKVEEQESLDSLDAKTNQYLYKRTLKIRKNSELEEVQHIEGTIPKIDEEWKEF